MSDEAVFAEPMDALVGCVVAIKIVFTGRAKLYSIRGDVQLKGKCKVVKV